MKFGSFKIQGSKRFTHDTPVMLTAQSVHSRPVKYAQFLSRQLSLLKTSKMQRNEDKKPRANTTL